MESLPLLFNPARYDPAGLDPETQEDLRTLIGFFEAKGLAQMKPEHHAGAWYDDSPPALAARVGPGAFARNGP